ncbi:energy-coupling factor ABC transporter ATP-binding protein [Ruminococcus sp. OA3]|uniref:energy-coupling factor ABC transporter ATP-binding protein n=1 Tax=Ruminococcus sp. OA3 TaxID=2914164 RepID=UPI001F058F4A|nr:ABC transporter ATP-binding protein [Ruminococcus sp. OA3]MCH1983172.1 energy-coupling factor ABC transporter ATP-binding protein [Ruminococcus sp. OA3]
MREPIVKVKDLHFAYADEKEALRGIDINIYQGERIAVIGSNGAGKSTFFLNVNGVLQAEAGEIYFRNTKITKKNLNELRKNIGIVFQDADNQIIASTVMAEVSFGPMNLRLPRDEVKQRVEEALEYMNITDFKDRPPHYLSGGEKKRVSIADIIAMKSEIIIFDEPTAALDPMNAQMLEEVLEKLQKEGKTMLISTHDVDFAYRWAERAVVFCDGEIIADGTPLDVFMDDSVVKRANLKRPMMLDVYEGLVASGHLPDEKKYPKTPDELKQILA